MDSLASVSPLTEGEEVFMTTRSETADPITTPEFSL
jgi:hypothetical protein